MGQLMLKALLEGTIEAGGKGECDVENYYAAVLVITWQPMLLVPSK